MLWLQKINKRLTGLSCNFRVTKRKQNKISVTP